MSLQLLAEATEDASRVGDAVDNRHVAARLALIGAAVAVGRGGAMVAEHVLDHDGELDTHGIAVERGHALVVHLESWVLALPSSSTSLIQPSAAATSAVVAAVLPVLEVDDAAFVDLSGLIEIARVVPDARKAASTGVSSKRIHLDQAPLGRGGVCHVDSLVGLEPPGAGWSQKQRYSHEARQA